MSVSLVCSEILAPATRCRGSEGGDAAALVGEGGSLAAALAEGLAKLLMHNHLWGGPDALGSLERGDVVKVNGHSHYGYLKWSLVPLPDHVRTCYTSPSSTNS